MQEEINRNNMRDVTVRVVNKRFWLEGVVNSQGKFDLALRIANQLLPPTLASLAATNSGRLQNVTGGEGPIINFISVNEKKDPPPPKKLIKISSQFVELAKDYSKVFAFKWNPLMSNNGSISFGRTNDGGVTSNETGTLSGTISNLFPKLASARNAGYVRIIQSGMVITKEGESAVIKKGQQIPFLATQTQQAVAVQTASVDYTLTVTSPTIVGEDKIDFQKLNVTIQLPIGRGANGAPLTSNNSVDTTLIVKNKESAVIGGVVQSQQETAYDKDDPEGTGVGVQAAQPGTGGASPIFQLLRSKNYRTSKSQYVVFITPEIIDSAASGTEKIRRKFRKRTR
jgi:pilus assembly protein CpaC